MLHQPTMPHPAQSDLSNQERWQRAMESLLNRDFLLACGLLMALFALV